MCITAYWTGDPFVGVFSQHTENSTKTLYTTNNDN